MSDTLIERVRGLAAELASQRQTHDSERRLSTVTVTALRSHRLLGALLPHELGGSELPPASYVELLETLAAADAATAWCVMTASTSTLIAAYLARETAHEMFGTMPFVAGVFAPGGKLVADGDGCRLSGTWSWASGSRHADWFLVGAIADRRHVVCFVPPSAVRVVDNWDTLGLAGTGSHDLVIENAAIPGTHVTSVFERTPWPAGALYRVPIFGLLATGIAGCALGVARGALDHVAKKLTAETSSAQLARYAECRAELFAARAGLVAAATRAYECAGAGSIDDATRGELRLAASFATHRAASIARSAFHLGGGSSVRAGSPLGNALRDLETVLTHKMVTDRVWPAAARAVLGLGTAPPDL